MKKLTVPLIALLWCIAMTACENQPTGVTSQNKVNTPQAVGVVLERVAQDRALENCPSGCGLSPDCQNAEHACTTTDCWIPIACCHEIDKRVFMRMRLNPNSSGTEKSREDIEALLVNCHRILVTDSTPDTDEDINVALDEDKSALYSSALFRGILQAENPTAQTFHFFNAGIGRRLDVVFKVVFNDGSEKFYDLSEPPY